MTAHRMMDLADNTIGFEGQQSPVTNTLRAERLANGNIEVSFCSAWAQAGASHSTDGALVLSRADAEALARVLVPSMMMPADMSTLRFFPVEPPSDDRLAELSAKVANKAEVEPVAYLKRFSDTYEDMGGNTVVDSGFEVCDRGEEGTFPVYATPPATTGASTVVTDERKLRDFIVTWSGALYPNPDELMAVIKANIGNPVAAQAGQVAVPDDPMDSDLPCDIKVGNVTIRKGCKLRTLVARMESLHGMAMAALPVVTPEKRAEFDLMFPRFASASAAAPSPAKESK